MRTGSTVSWLLAVFALAAPAAYAVEDISNFNTIETRSPATIDKIKVSNPKFFFRRVLLQSCGGLDLPVVSFGVSNHSSVAIRRLFLRALLKTDKRAVPLADPEINYIIPGGLQPGETKRFDLDAAVVGDWRGVSKQQARGAVLTLTLSAVEDAKGGRIVR